MAANLALYTLNTNKYICVFRQVMIHFSVYRIQKQSCEMVRKRVTTFSDGHLNFQTNSHQTY